MGDVDELAADDLGDERVHGVAPYVHRGEAHPRQSATICIRGCKEDHPHGT